MKWNRKSKNWMFKIAPALVLGAGMLSFASPRAAAQEQDPRWERDPLKWHQQQERSPYGNGAVRAYRRQEQEQFRYQERVERSGYYGGGPYRQYSPYQSGPYGAYSQNGHYGIYEQHGTRGGWGNSRPSHDNRLWFGNGGIFSRRYGHR
jgi:hypothetical protein